MRNKEFGGIGILWGGALVAKWLASGATGAGAYSAGQYAGVAFGAGMLLAGLYGFFKRAPE
jgi:hypothetical protein